MNVVVLFYLIFVCFIGNSFLFYFLFCSLMIREIVINCFIYFDLPCLRGRHVSVVRSSSTFSFVSPPSTFNCFSFFSSFFLSVLISPPSPLSFYYFCFIVAVVVIFFFICFNCFKSRFSLVIIITILLSTLSSLSTPAVRIGTVC